MMTAHELAAILLAGDDLEVVFDNDGEYVELEVDAIHIAEGMLVL